MASIARYYSSTAVKTTLSSSIGSSDTTMTVASMSGFPSSYPYTLILEKDSANEEIVTVTALVGTSLTITRGVDGTSGRSHSAGIAVEHGVIALDFTNFRAHEANAANVHDIGSGASVVGTTTTQTLSNKTLGSALAAGGFKITGLADPTNAQDAATKNWTETGLTSQLNLATSAKTAAQAAQAAAETAETNAETAETNAETAQAAAASSASAASTSATNAASSASSASTSASTATTQATNASTSATAAASSASSASTSATTATTKASEASTSATNAASSASSASTSATNAASSASTASTAATNAAASASAASTSASNAATSATAAQTAETNAETAETNAASSASSAGTSASNASTSASSASSSASSASTSASNAATSETNAASSAASAAASFDNFDDRYLGSKSSEPSVDNDGNALLTGALYFNSVSNAMKVYNGSTWDLVAPDTSAFISKTIVDAKGDLIVATAADTVDRIGVGTNGYVLTADSTQTPGIKWAAVPSDSTKANLSGASFTGAVSVNGNITSTSSFGLVSAPRIKLSNNGSGIGELEFANDSGGTAGTIFSSTSNGSTKLAATQGATGEAGTVGPFWLQAPPSRNQTINTMSANVLENATSIGFPPSVSGAAYDFELDLMLNFQTALGSGNISLAFSNASWSNAMWWATWGSEAFTTVGAGYNFNLNNNVSTTTASRSSMGWLNSSVAANTAQTIITAHTTQRSAFIKICGKLVASGTVPIYPRIACSSAQTSATQVMSRWRMQPWNPANSGAWS